MECEMLTSCCAILCLLSRPFDMQRLARYVSLRMGARVHSGCVWSARIEEMAGTAGRGHGISIRRLFSAILGDGVLHQPPPKYFTGNRKTPLPNSRPGAVPVGAEERLEYLRRVGFLASPFAVVRRSATAVLLAVFDTE